MPFRVASEREGICGLSDLMSANAFHENPVEAELFPGLVLDQGQASELLP